MVIQRFVFADGFRTSVDPSVAGAVCKGLQDIGRLTAANLVDVSRPEDAPLHSAFEWNDAEAAEKWREQQARTIIGNLRVITEDTAEPVKMYFNLRVEAPEYKSLDVILQDENDTALLLKNAMREMLTFRRKYERLKELSEVFTAIDKIVA